MMTGPGVLIKVGYELSYGVLSGKDETEGVCECSGRYYVFPETLDEAHVGRDVCSCGV